MIVKADHKENTKTYIIKEKVYEPIDNICSVVIEEEKV